MSILLRSFQPCFLSMNLKNPGIRYRFFFIFIYKYTRIYLYKYKSTASSCFSSECTVIKASDRVSWAPQKQTLQEGQEAGHRRRPGAGSSLWEGSCLAPLQPRHPQSLFWTTPRWGTIPFPHREPQSASKAPARQLPRAALPTMLPWVALPAGLLLASQDQIPLCPLTHRLLLPVFYMNALPQSHETP